MIELICGPVHTIIFDKLQNSSILLRNKTKQNTVSIMKYRIVAKDNHLAVHSVGYFGESGKEKAQKRCDSGYCARFWSDKAQAKNGFIVVVDD